MSPEDRSRLLLALALALLSLVLVCPRTPTGEPARAVRDSVRITQPAFDSAQATRTQGAARHQAGSLAASERARRAEAAAAAWKARADTLAASARRIGYTSNQWALAYSARTAEADSLRAALGHERAAADSARAAAASWRAAYATDSTRRVAIERLNAGLALDIAKMEPRCRVLGRPCPSRTASYLAGFLTAAAATIAP